MIFITPSAALTQNFSTQIVITSSDRQYHMTIDCSTRATSYTIVRTPSCLLESNMAFTTRMCYGGRRYPDQLPVIEYAGEYSCAFPLWSDAIVQVQCKALSFTLYGLAVRPALAEEAER